FLEIFKKNIIVDVVLEQSALSLKIKTPLGDDAVILDRLEGFEGLSMPFEFVLQLHSSKQDIDFGSLLGKEIIASLSTQHNIRYFSGIAGKVEQLQTIGDQQGNFKAYYQIAIYPKFWITKFTGDHRIFQNMSAISIITSVLAENGVIEIDNKVSSCGQGVREFCVQYGESAFDFVSRLMEEEGIFYFFTHSKHGHKMVLADGNESAKPLPKGIDLSLSQTNQLYLDKIIQFNYQKQIVTKKFKTVDYNYLTPGTQLLPQAPGDGLGGTVYEFPGQFGDMGSGESLANYRIQEQEWAQTLANGKGTVVDFSAGKTFNLQKHPRDDFNQEYMLYRVKHLIYQKTLSEDISNEEHNAKSTPSLARIYENEFLAFPMTTPFRAPRITKKKRIYSNQTAIVTGPGGEEVFCDKLGRIKIHFHWDIRNGLNENSSCWVRVAQNWAGGGWGGLVTPRIGMEVVVTFIEGDPDRPLVIGCVYNGKNTPPGYTTSSPTKSTFKTNSSKHASGFNELRFEDKAGSEEIYTHAEKDVVTVIENSRDEKINKSNDTLLIKKGSKYVTLSGGGTTHSLHIDNGDKKIKIVKGNYSVQITSGNYSITLDKGDMKIKVNGDIKVESTKNITFKALKNIELKAGVDIKVTAGKMIQSKAGTDIKNKAGLNIESKAGVAIKNKAGTNIESKAGVAIKNKAGTEIQSKAGMKIQNKAGMEIQSKAGMKIQNKAGMEIQSKAGMKIQNKAGMEIQSKAGLQMQSKAGLQMQNKAGLQMQNKAGLQMQNKAGLMMDNKAGLMMKIQGGLMLQLKGGLMLQAKGGLMGQYQGGVMCMVKGVLTKIN
ncbi:MAG: type VI secretion system tip protein VgrG, partial [Alphaproteobacteria bacterium]|nr:type VI secretion system tip protein VgrG [Alphaproteobacteria bacterium]